MAVVDGTADPQARPLEERAVGLGLLLAAAAPVAVMTFRGLPLVTGLAAFCLLVGWGASRALRRPRDTLMLGALVLLFMVATLSLERTPRRARAPRSCSATSCLPSSSGCCSPPPSRRR